MRTMVRRVLILFLGLGLTLTALGCEWVLSSEQDPSETQEPDSQDEDTTQEGQDGDAPPDDDPDWKLTWYDEFNQETLDSNTWTRQSLINPYNGEWQQYTGAESTAYTQNGTLVIKASHNGGGHEAGNYTSARVISNPGGNDGTSGIPGKTFLYGRLEARIKLPTGKGIWPAFWLLGDSIGETGGDTDWPASGEIDILETGAKNVDSYYGHATVGQAIHYSNETDNWEYRHGSQGHPDGLWGDDYHVYGIEWDSQKILWTIDGREVHREYINKDHLSEFHQPFYVIFNIAVGGTYTYDPDATTGFPKYMYIDWIRYYKPRS